MMTAYFTGGPYDGAVEHHDKPFVTVRVQAPGQPEIKDPRSGAPLVVYHTYRLASGSLTTLPGSGDILATFLHDCATASVAPKPT